MQQIHKKQSKGARTISIGIAGLLLKERPSYARENSKVIKKIEDLKKQSKEQQVALMSIPKQKLEKINFLISKFKKETRERGNEIAAYGALDMAILAMSSKGRIVLEKSPINTLKSFSDLTRYLKNIKELREKNTLSKKQYDALMEICKEAGVKPRSIDEFGEIIDKM